MFRGGEGRPPLASSNFSMVLPFPSPLVGEGKGPGDRVRSAYPKICLCRGKPSTKKVYASSSAVSTAAKGQLTWASVE